MATGSSRFQTFEFNHWHPDVFPTLQNLIMCTYTFSWSWKPYHLEEMGVVTGEYETSSENQVQSSLEPKAVVCGAG